MGGCRREFGQIHRGQEEEGPVGSDSQLYSTCDGKLRSHGIGFALIYLLMYFFGLLMHRIRLKSS